MKHRKIWALKFVFSNKNQMNLRVASKIQVSKPNRPHLKIGINIGFALNPV